MVLAPKHLLVLHSAHSFMANVQPCFVRVEHIDRIVPAARRLALRLAAVVKYTIELVVHWFRRFPRNGCHDVWTDRTMRES